MDGFYELCQDSGACAQTDDMCVPVLSVSTRRLSSCVDVAVLQKFDKWMETEGLWQDGIKSVFVTCGDWDLKTM